MFPISSFWSALGKWYKHTHTHWDTHDILMMMADWWWLSIGRLQSTTTTDNIGTDTVIQVAMG